MPNSGACARLKSLRSSLETEINSLESQRSAIQTKIANGTASDVELQQAEELADQIAARVWDKLRIEAELGGLA